MTDYPGNNGSPMECDDCEYCGQIMEWVECPSD